MSERPSTEQIRTVRVAGDWVEIFMEIHNNGQACEPLTAYYFPNGPPVGGVGDQISCPPSDNRRVRFNERDVLEEDEVMYFKKFVCIVGKLTISPYRSMIEL